VLIEQNVSTCPVCRSQDSNSLVAQPAECIEVLWHYVIIALSCLFVGYWLGGIRGKIVRRNSLRELNSQSLELLEAKKSYSVKTNRAEEFARQERLLKLALSQAKQSSEQLKQLHKKMETQTKKLHVDRSYLRLKASQSHDRAVMAANIARKATQELKKLELAAVAKQRSTRLSKHTASSSNLRSAAEFRQRNLNAYTDVVRRVSNRDSARLAKLKSSNEAGRKIK